MTTAIAKLARRWNATLTQRANVEDEEYDDAEYIEQLKNWNAVLMQKTALQALVVVFEKRCRVVEFTSGFSEQRHIRESGGKIRLVGNRRRV